jgi:hypothetical protein
LAHWPGHQTMNIGTEKIGDDSHVSLQRSWKKTRAATLSV